jgi:hypothetical protein
VASGSHAYVSDNDSNIHIISIDAPSSPVELSSFAVSDVEDFAVSGDYLYIAAGDDGLRIYNVSLPLTPFFVGYFDPDQHSNAYGVCVDSSYAYLVGGSFDFMILSVVNPRDIVELSHLETDDINEVNIALSGSNAFVAASGSGLRVISIADPANPVEIGSYDVSGDYYDLVEVASPYAYAVDFWEMLRIFSIARPWEPLPVGYYQLDDAGSGGRIAADSSYVYLTDGYGGLIILQYSGPPVSIDEAPDDSRFPRAILLEQNFPNPFNPYTEITYHIPDMGDKRIPVELVIYDMRGRAIRALYGSENVPGPHSVLWDGRDANGSEVPSGVYFYRLKAGTFSETRKMLLMK